MHSLKVYSIRLVNFYLFWCIVCASLLIYHLLILFQLTPLGRWGFNQSGELRASLNDEWRIDIRVESWELRVEITRRIVFCLNFYFLLKEQIFFCLFWWLVCSSLLIYHLVILFQLTPLGRFLCYATKEPKGIKGTPLNIPVLM